MGFFIAKMEHDTGVNIPKSTMILMTALFIPAFFIVIAIHEAGHALAGMMMKFDFKIYVVGPFLWSKEQNNWKFKWNKNVNMAGGLVVCVPIGTENLNKRFAIYAAGGPITSLLFSAFSYLLVIVFQTLNTANNSSLQALGFFFLMLTFLSLLIFFATIIPIHSAGFSSDGARMIKMLKGGEATKFEILLLKIIANSISGIRPKLIEMEDLVEAQTIAEKLKLPFGVYIHGLLHQTTLDLGEIDQAEIHLQHYIQEIEEIPAGMRNGVWLDAAFFYAYAKADLDTAVKYWALFKPNAFVSKALIYATEAAISFLKNEDLLAVSKINDSLKEIPNMLDKGNGLALQEKMIDLNNKILNKPKF